MAGRPPGARNKPRRALIALLQERFPAYDPVVEMAIVANDENQDSQVRFNANKEVAQYVHSKLKAVETTGEVNLDVRIGWGDTHTVQSEAITGDPS